MVGVQSINKYELPPPVDKDLYYGSMALVASKDKDGRESSSFNRRVMWDKIYEKLMGGFEDLDKESDMEDEEEYHSTHNLKQNRVIQKKVTLSWMIILLLSIILAHLVLRKKNMFFQMTVRVISD